MREPSNIGFRKPKSYLQKGVSPKRLDDLLDAKIKMNPLGSCPSRARAPVTAGYIVLPIAEYDLSSDCTRHLPANMQTFE